MVISRYQKYKASYIAWREKHRDLMLFYKRRDRDRIRYGGMRTPVFERDKYMCVKCGMTNAEHRKEWNKDLTIDHIDGSGIHSEIKNNAMENLQTLCFRCHGYKDGVVNQFTGIEKRSGE